MSVIIPLLVIAVTSLVIYYVGNIFAESSSKIGDYLNLPRSVKGATFDAISSSLPELLVALYAIFVFKKFEVGIGTIAGSALFNLLVIPGICVLVAPVVFRVGKKVISRDALFYIISVFILLTLLLYFKVWGIGIAVVLLLTYFIYVKIIINDTKKHREQNKQDASTKNINIKREVGIALLMLVAICIATFFLTDASIDLSYALGVAPIIIAFTITAAATSVPDTVISVANAKKGDVTDATSNVFGSNIFDILVGLGLPLIIFYFLVGPVTITFIHLEIILGLLGSTILILFFLADDQILTRKEAWLMLAMYVAFIVYIVILSFA